MSDKGGAAKSPYDDATLWHQTPRGWAATTGNKRNWVVVSRNLSTWPAEGYSITINTGNDYDPVQHARLGPGKSANCLQCPPGTEAPAGSQYKHCTAIPGFYFDKQRHWFPQRCPTGSTTSSHGATSAVACECDFRGGYFWKDRARGAGGGPACSKCRTACPPGTYRKSHCTATADMVCETLKAPCNSAQFVFRSGSAWVNATHPGAQWACGDCPEHSSLVGTAKSHCEDTPWVSAKGITCATMQSMRACTPSGEYGVGWSSYWGDWLENADVHNVTAKQACCFCGGGQHHMAQNIESCECNSGYYDDELVSGVHCVRSPARLGNAPGSRCNIAGMGFGMKAHVSIMASTKKTAQLGTMVQFLAGVDTGLIAAADYNDACVQFFAQAKALGGADRICGSRVELFGRASTAEHAILLGTATLQCHGLPRSCGCPPMLLHTCCYACRLS